MKIPKIDPNKLTDEQKKELHDFMMDGIRERVLTDDQFAKELQEETARLIDDLKKDKDDHIMARMLVYGFKDPKDGKRPMYFFAFADMPEPDKRQDSFKAIGAKFTMEMKQIPLYAIMVTEAWTRKMTKEEEAERSRLKKNISDYEDKQECLIVAGSTIDGREKMAMIPFTRDKDNNIVPDKPDFEFHEAQNFLLRNFFMGAAIGNQIRNDNEKDTGEDGNAEN